MITKLNLSSRPFRNRTLPYLVAVLLLAFALAGAILSFAKLNETGTKNKQYEEQIEEWRKEIAALKGKGELVQQQLSPEQQNLLIASHKLVANKSFGWSQLFYDLERVMPGSVSASRISVENVYQTNDGRTQAELEFAVLSKDYQSVISMIDTMNSSGSFSASLRSQALKESEAITYMEYTLHLIYTSPTVYTPSATQDNNVADNGGNQ